MSVDQNSTSTGNKEPKATVSNDKRTSGIRSAFVEVDLGERTVLALNTERAHEKFVVVAGSRPPKEN